MSRIRYSDGAVHIADDQNEVEIKDIQRAKSAARALIFYLRDNGVETSVSAGKEIYFTK